MCHISLVISELCCRQEVVLLENEVAFNEATSSRKENREYKIQQQIGEVNEIFKDLAILVHGIMSKEP